MQYYSCWGEVRPVQRLDRYPSLRTSIKHELATRDGSDIDLQPVKLSQQERLDGYLRMIDATVYGCCCVCCFDSCRKLDSSLHAYATGWMLLTGYIERFVPYSMNAPDSAVQAFFGQHLWTALSDILFLAFYTCCAAFPSLNCMGCYAFGGLACTIMTLCTNAICVYLLMTVCWVLGCGLCGGNLCGLCLGVPARKCFDWRQIACNACTRHPVPEDLLYTFENDPNAAEDKLLTDFAACCFDCCKVTDCCDSSAAGFIYDVIATILHVTIHTLAWGTHSTCSGTGLLYLL
jgi:hypothetical protein